MHSALLIVANAIALTVLLSFQFSAQRGAEPIAQHIPHYLQLQKAPQLAVMNKTQGASTQEVSQQQIQLGMRSSDRLVF